MITKADLFHYLESEANKIVSQINLKYKLVNTTVDFYKEVKKIDKAFVDITEISDKKKRITIVIDDHKVIWTFNYLLK